jgi:uncharacterized protein
MIKSSHSSFNQEHALHELKHFLPAQAPLKDFIHHNTLHAFQNKKFMEGLVSAFEIFGYKVSLTLREYRELFQNGKIDEAIMDRCIQETKGADQWEDWKNKMLHGKYHFNDNPRIGRLRSHWKRSFKIDMDSLVHPTLFRLLAAYLDQGISIWNFPIEAGGFLNAIRELEKNTYTSLFKSKRIREWLINGNTELTYLLKHLVGDEKWFEQYIFDQQFAHQGWSGLVSAIEDAPYTLLDKKNISLHDLIVLECLMEMDQLDHHFGPIWSPLALKMAEEPIPLFEDVKADELQEVLFLFQKSFEESFYLPVLKGLLETRAIEPRIQSDKSFQALLCIDDRECSLRRYIEKMDPAAATFGTPGFFGVEFYFKPENEQFYTKLCPAPVFPKYVIKEQGANNKRKADLHYNPKSHGFLLGWIYSQTLGFISAMRLFLNIFNPKVTAATSLSFNHMDKDAALTVECVHNEKEENGLQIGYTIEEMAIRVENLLKSIGLVKDFAPLVYVIGHGASSTNNPHYAAYDCGACSGRAGSVNARVLSTMANHAEVRLILKEKGIEIPKNTQFIGALHDTTRDEIDFYLQEISAENMVLHELNVKTFNQALEQNALERSRRFASITDKTDAKKVHRQVKNRSVSLFEPRPELNHATNALCIVGRRQLSDHLFLDRRSFLNSYDYSVDPEGKYLLGILRAAAPVCGGINLEYYFSRVDNQKLGAGSKLPHNVMGLIGVANGTDGDLRPGLPSQMIEVHDPVRLMIIVEQFPDVVLKTIQTEPATFEWFQNEWVHLAVIHPEKNEVFRYQNEEMKRMDLPGFQFPTSDKLEEWLKSEMENLPIIKLTNHE